MNAYLCIVVWAIVKYLEEKRKNAKAHDTIEELLRKLADVRSDLNKIEKQLEIKEQECLEANRRIKRMKEGVTSEKQR